MKYSVTCNIKLHEMHIVNFGNLFYKNKVKNQVNFIISKTWCQSRNLNQNTQLAHNIGVKRKFLFIEGYSIVIYSRNGVHCANRPRYDLKFHEPIINGITYFIHYTPGPFQKRLEEMIKGLEVTKKKKKQSFSVKCYINNKYFATACLT